MAKRRRKIAKYIREAEPRPNRIEADLSKQAPNNSWNPPTYYEDMPFTCIDCGRDQVWTATQQKWWYEVAKGPVFSSAKRCVACRRKLRDLHQGTPRKSHKDRQSSKLA
jgi:hypothetical protein